MPLASFVDCLGREHSLRLTVAMLPKLRAIGFDFAKFAEMESKIGTLLFSDSEVLATALYIVGSVTLGKEEFAAGIDGPTLEAGGEALLDAVIDFFPRSRVAKQMRGRVKEALTEMDDKIIEAMSSKGSSGNAGSSPVSAASIRAG